MGDTRTQEGVADRLPWPGCEGGLTVQAELGVQGGVEGIEVGQVRRGRRGRQAEGPG